MRNLEGEIEKALLNRRQVNALRTSLTRMRDARREGMLRFSLDELKELKALRRLNVARVHENIGLLKEVVESRHGRFFLARDAVEASKYVVDVVKRGGVRLVVKTKSLTTEEVGLNKILEEAGAEVVETDLGERVVQLAGERPSHILAPAIHKDVESIAAILSPSLKPDPVEITRYIRRELREKFLQAEMGVTGANAIAAEAGAVFIVTNEGNERFVTTIPRIYICIAGVEKVVSTVEEALKILRILVPSATGQSMSSYVTIISPNSDGFGKEREFHLVLVDNGRLNALEDGRLSEALECIRCSACFNICPTYRIVGGHVFGHLYSGPIGLPWTAITSGYLHAYAFSSLCVSCGLCKAECPVDIDIPMMISRIKDWGNRNIQSSAPYLLRNYDTLLRMGAKSPRPSNMLICSKLGRLALERLADIDRRRPLPPLAPKDLYSLAKEMKQASSGRRRVALFTDSLIMYMFPSIGVDAIKILNRLGVYCVVPDQLSSGMPLVQYGYLKEASEVARKNTEGLVKLVNEGYDIVCLEPTAEYCVKEIYPILLHGSCREAEKLASKTYSFADYILELGIEFNAHAGAHVAYHWPCHSRKRGASTAPFARLLSQIGFKVSLVDEGCCGMAGTWGMRRGYKGYELSQEVGKGLKDALEKTGAERFTTDGTACLVQINTLTGDMGVHAIRLMASMLVGKEGGD